MRFHYDKKVDALYIRFDESAYRESDEVAEGVILDYDRQGKLIGLEILDAAKKLHVKFQSSLKRNELPLSIRSYRS